ncbi:Uncharacterized protein dnm_009770 [Desulfonema magnum]|uniref:Uncharacterized protein n=1 Tax=Desulfonema magnum TaxID=45655 RepID=A0A975GLL9_9BACT|nr:Uncharacterized protein dnm_009770 [Desulfonema magnum]
MLSNFSFYKQIVISFKMVISVERRATKTGVFVKKRLM